MILVAGIPSEAPLRLVIESAESGGVPHVVFNQRESGRTEICLDIRDGAVDGTIRIRETDYGLNAFSGVYVRMMDARDLPEERLRAREEPTGGAGSRTDLLYEAFADWLEVAPCRVMNRCGAMATNGSKPYQAQFILRAGFRIPETLVTNVPEAVRGFLEKHRRIVFKSISSERSIVRLLESDRLDDLDRVRHLPTQFQEFVPGDNIRVHVVGEELFATEIRSDAVDYRYAGRDGRDADMVPLSLPHEIEARCRALSRALGLPLCGIDLKRTPDGRYYCFEVNPSPGYSYYQEHTGQDIAGAIVRHLAEGK